MCAGTRWFSYARTGNIENIGGCLDGTLILSLGCLECEILPCYQSADSYVSFASIAGSLGWGWLYFAYLHRSYMFNSQKQ